ncbi:ribonuclease 3-like protein [Musa troglodytarum]|uniref:Ribonuclease 3-like protein n=1 Tax=Musa troglodytarum TaxID=320322 RepID=A0A9E7GJR0_9LILI|nr:ribonuclease 3-like protein [Musa troglodytarum]
MDEQPVTTLYELCHKQGRSIEIKNWKRGFVNNTSVFIDGDLKGIGCSEQKTIAKLNAARDALQKLSALKKADMEVELSSAAANGTAEEKDGSKQKLNQFCIKKHWIMPIYNRM